MAEYYSGNNVDSLAHHEHLGFYKMKVSSAYWRFDGRKGHVQLHQTPELLDQKQ